VLIISNNSLKLSSAYDILLQKFQEHTWVILSKVKWSHVITRM